MFENTSHGVSVLLCARGCLLNVSLVFGLCSCSFEDTERSVVYFLANDNRINVCPAILGASCDSLRRGRV